jgi:ribonuclease J
MYRLVRPRVAIPVHGELRHMVEHAALARQLGVSDALVAENGTVVRLGPTAACVVDHVATGRLVLEGRRPVPADGALVRGRSKAIYNGSVVVTVVLAGLGSSAEDVQFSSFGLIEQGEDALVDSLCRATRDAVGELDGESIRQDESVRGAVRLAIRRLCRQMLDKRPVVEVHVVRL